MKVKIGTTFVGTPEEVAEYGGQLPPDFKDREDRLSEGERNSFNGKITAGTEMDVSEKRAKELEDLGLIEGSTKKKVQGKPLLVNDRQEKKAIEEEKEKKANVTETPKARK